MTTCQACQVSCTDNDWLVENLKAHAFPIKECQAAYLKPWLIFCCMPIDTKDLLGKFLCSRHFSVEDYLPGDDKELKSEAIPHLYPPSVSSHSFNEYANWSDYNYDLNHYQLMEDTSEYLEEDNVTERKQILENVKSTLCRLCGMTKLDLFPIYESIHEENHTTVVGLIEAHLPVKITRSDILPLNVCSECLSLLQQWNAMYTTCQAAESALQKIFCQSKWLELEEDSEILDCREKLPSVEQVSVVPEDIETLVTCEAKVEQLLISENNDEPQHSFLSLDINAATKETDSRPTKIASNKKKKRRVVGTRSILKPASSIQKTAENEGSKQTFRCKYCRETFETLFKKKQHLSDCSEIPSICETCGKVVSHRKNMVLHQKQHKYDMTCDICGVWCSSPASFETHQVKVHNKEPKCVFCCEPCCRVYYSLNQYTTHVKVHDAGKIKQMFNYEPFLKVGCSSEYVCVFCKSEFNNKIHLIVHLNTPKQLKCSTCQEEFCNERGLVVHNGRKVFCRYCKKVFCVVQMMRAHERTHTKEKPFNCKYCSASFRTANQRDSHQTIHGPPMFECSFCKKKFRYRAGFQDHLNYHLGNLVTCKLCNRRYGGNFSLMRHVRRYHNRANTCNGRLVVTENSQNVLTT